MIPDHMRYRPPEWWRARYRQYGLDFGRWRTDTRYHSLPAPRKLPWWELRAIDVPLLLKRITRYNERQGSR